MPPAKKQAAKKATKTTPKADIPSFGNIRQGLEDHFSTLGDLGDFGAKVSLAQAIADDLDRQVLAALGGPTGPAQQTPTVSASLAKLYLGMLEEFGVSEEADLDPLDQYG